MPNSNRHRAKYFVKEMNKTWANSRGAELNAQLQYYPENIITEAYALRLMGFGGMFKYRKAVIKGLGGKENTNTMCGLRVPKTTQVLFIQSLLLDMYLAL